MKTWEEMGKYGKKGTNMKTTRANLGQMPKRPNPTRQKMTRDEAASSSLFFLLLLHFQFFQMHSNNKEEARSHTQRESASERTQFESTKTQIPNTFGPDSIGIHAISRRQPGGVR
jgi:hypothetical protein